MEENKIINESEELIKIIKALTEVEKIAVLDILQGVIILSTSGK